MATAPRAIVGRVQFRYPAVAVAGKVISLASKRAGLPLDLNELVPERKPPAIPNDWREIHDIGVDRPGPKRLFLWDGKDARARRRAPMSMLGTHSTISLGLPRERAIGNRNPLKVRIAAIL